MASTEKLFLTEDKVRDTVNTVLGLTDSQDVQAGVGQITTFNQLGISGVSDKPDGWYLSYDKSQPALILECKAQGVDIGTKKCVEEIKKNCRIVLDAGWEKCFGLLTNGKKSLGFMNNEPVDISFGSENANFFYQDDEWIGGRDTYYLDTQHLSELSALFVRSVLQAHVTSRFSYTGAMIPARFIDDEIRLPITLVGEPDWAFMEQYMQQQMDKAEALVEHLDAVWG